MHNYLHDLSGCVCMRAPECGRGYEYGRARECVCLGVGVAYFSQI